MRAMMTNLGITAAWRVLAVAARAAQGDAKAGARAQKLDAFAGGWTLDGDMKAGPQGPGGKATRIYRFRRCRQQLEIGNRASLPRLPNAMPSSVETSSSTRPPASPKPC